MIASTNTVSAQSLKPENNTDMLFGRPFGLFHMRDSGRVRLAWLFNMTDLPVSACMLHYCCTLIIRSSTIISLLGMLFIFIYLFIFGKLLWSEMLTLQ